MDQDNIISYQSSINPDFQVLIVYDGHEMYEAISNQLRNINSIAALQVGSKTIVIDGELVAEQSIDKDQLLAIEAHEIAHSMLGHEAGYDEQSEKEADLFAIALLDLDGYDRASEFLKDRLKDLYNIDYTEFEDEWISDGQDEELDFDSANQ